MAPSGRAGVGGYHPGPHQGEEAKGQNRTTSHGILLSRLGTVAPLYMMGPGGLGFFLPSGPPQAGYYFTC